MVFADIKIGMISVLYNPSEDMVKSIFLNARGADKLVIIDNSDFSNKKLIDSFNSQSIDFVYIPNYRNAGLAKAINMGMQIICSLKMDWCLIFDQDSKIANNILREYKNVIEKNKTKKIGIIGPQHIYDNRKLLPIHGTKKKRWLMLSGNLINVNAYIAIGGFNEGFFLDGLDVDYDYRLIEHGYSIVQCLGAAIYHCPGKRKSISLGTRKLYYGVAEPFRYYHQARAGIYNGLMHSKKYGVFELGRKLFKIIFLFDEKRKYLKSFKSGILDGIHWYYAK
ncbi:glycosyltransferase [Butyrivibrio sp. MC2021]|uniref:glycosyltransferase n=1 Tax=Butyrivibrio sp. MC2021 TaxID=1408306 RepID=UPI00047C822C|nr:glycosyltransferase [Butyrivibrio sp. MC2021]